MAEAKAQNRYRVIERLESGGMAEVFRGEAESLAGFKKSVAIKRVLPHLAQNEKFIRMFLDEARLCARLNHANIVQVFDIGHVENTYFIVMEFVDGVNLKAVIEHLRKRNAPFPIGIAVQICIQICNGLQYAHDLTDADGTMLNIVHRDMSPPNVLISKRGEVKIVDFGLAKAAMSVEKTDPGVVKGKFGYLAPETASGSDADPQADIFAVGIILWEMLAGRRLFFGDSDFATVKLVQQANVPSLRKINPDVPEELEAVILRSLARDKAARFASAEALAGDLSRFLANQQISVVQFDVAKLVKEVVEEKRASQKKEGRRDASIIDRLIQEELMRFTSLEGEAEGGGEGAPQGAPGAGTPGKPEEFVNTSDWASDVLGDFDLGGALGDEAGFGAPAAAETSQEAPAATASAEQSADLSPPQAPPDMVSRSDGAGEQPEAVEPVEAVEAVDADDAVEAAPAARASREPAEAAARVSKPGAPPPPPATPKATSETKSEASAERAAEKSEAKPATKSVPPATAKPAAKAADSELASRPTVQLERKSGSMVLAGVAAAVVVGVGAVLYFSGIFGR